MKYRIVKLRLELEDTSRANIHLYNTIFRVLLMRQINLYKRRGPWQYPVKEADLYRMLDVVQLDTVCYVGIYKDALTTEQQRADYDKMVDVEYGEHGVEIRIVRKALEDLLYQIKEGR